MAAPPPRMSFEPLSQTEVDRKVREYEQFANDALKRDLAAVTQRRASIEAELQEWQELEQSILRLQESASPEYKALVDLGAGVHCRAAVPDPTRIFIAAGLGFHVECTLPEALHVALLRRELLQAKVDACVGEAARVRARLRFVMDAIGELQALHLQPQ